MEQIVIQVKDKKKAQALKNFLQTLDFVESVTEPGMNRQGRQIKSADFFSIAGLWAGRDISQESIRKEAWPQRI
ncbi:MAG: hypothetical protein IMZ53_09645 [Thermoplasmata archaeon]|nr:hypothetical protein [Thermoplasmata archaeon]